MKRILIFIGLKLAELLALGGIVVGLAWVGHYLEHSFNLSDRSLAIWRTETVLGSWGDLGLNIVTTANVFVLLLVPLTILGLVLIGLFGLFLANWKWAGKLVIILALVGVVGCAAKPKPTTVDYIRITPLPMFDGSSGVTRIPTFPFNK